MVSSITITDVCYTMSQTNAWTEDRVRAAELGSFQRLEEPNAQFQGRPVGSDETFQGCATAFSLPDDTGSEESAYQVTNTA